MAPKETAVKLNLRFRESRILLEEFKLGVWLVIPTKISGRRYLLHETWVGEVLLCSGVGS